MLAPQHNFLYRFLEIVNSYPHQTAVLEDGTRRTSYRELLQHALQVAGLLQMHCLNDRVGISIAKSAHYIVAVLGCWFAKKTFVPLDEKLPALRKDFILADADIGFVLTQNEMDDCLSEDHSFTPDPDIPINHPAYIIYTSGTTGEPKGVLVSHNGIVNLADCQRRTFEVDETAHYLFYLSTNFDASISDISVSLLSGATLVIETEESLSIATALPDLIKTRQITHMDIPPALLKLLESKDVADCLKTIIIGGEAADIATVRRWSQKVNLVNVYGPTEATVCTSMCKCSTNWPDPLIGQPLDNTEYEIFDENNEVCPDGTAGELYIAGIGLALGYINNVSLTQEKFVTLQGKRFYRTGDRVKRLSNGDFKFLGRMDRQVKIRGQLVELAEVEAVLNAHPLVQRSTVMTKKLTEQGRENLIAFVQLGKTEGSVSKKDLQEYLGTRLPAWMIPTSIQLMELPITASGKVDQQKLLDYPLHTVNNSHENLNGGERLIADIFKAVLNINSVSADDHFFDIGGDSLGAVELLLECERRGLDLSAETLLQEPTPRYIARHLANKNTVKMSVQELLKEIDLPAKNLYSPSPGDVTEHKMQHILLTGSTGFLGSALLLELLSNTDCHIHCLIRAKDEQAALKRLQATCQGYQLVLPAHFENRVHFISGDITQESFGLKPDQYETFTNQIDQVYHCAAVVNMIYPYSKLKNVNLEGVKRVLTFCCQGKRKPLHYASTLSVFVSTDRNQGTVYEDDILTETRYVYGGYGQTKFAAEKCLLSVPPETCDIWIYRFGLLTGNTQTGISARNDFLGRFVKGAKTLGQLPRDPNNTLAVDITPIDYAVQAMFQISVSNTKHRVFHIANPSPLKYNDFLTLLLEEKIISNILPYNEWEHCIKVQPERSTDEHLCLLSLCRLTPETFEQKRVMDLFQATGIQFNQHHVRETFPQKCPLPDRELLVKYVTHFLSEMSDI